MDATIIIPTTALTAIGGKVWAPKTGGAARVYFNDVAERAGLEVLKRFVGSRRIALATHRGESVSNGNANWLADHYAAAKVWYDTETGKFFTRGLDDADAARVVRSIRAQLTEA